MPSSNSFFVALRGPHDWFLRTPAQLCKHAADMRGMVADMKLILDELGDPAAGPNVPPKAMGFGAFKQPADKLSVLVLVKQRRRAGRGVVP